MMILSLALFSALQLASPPKPALRSKLEQRLDELIETQSLPALGGALVIDGEVVAIAARGVRRLGHEEPVTTGDLWHLGSCTKAMTATLAALAIEETELEWSSALALLKPQCPKMHEGWSAVSLLDLLHHAGGAPAGTGAYGLLGLQLRGASKGPLRGRELLLRGLLAKSPPDPAGTVFRYSNEGYVMASALVAHALDESWEESMRSRIFEPLGMTSAGFGPPGEADEESTPDQPEGHRADGTPAGRGVFADNPPAIGPAGTVHASLQDWAQFAALHASQGARLAENGKFDLLQHESLRELHTPGPFDGHAGGWIVTERQWAGALDPETQMRSAGRALTHSGSNTMWYCAAWIAPERRMALLAVCNQGTDGARVACDQVIGALLQQLDSPK